MRYANRSSGWAWAYAGMLLAWHVAGCGACAAGEAAAPPAVVDAAAYPTLQAALDAVPSGGGLVRLPPGRFELTKPLVLERAETRVEGAGRATHLVNTNTDGEPALNVRAPGYSDKSRGKRVWRVTLATFRVSGLSAEPFVEYDSIATQGAMPNASAVCALATAISAS